MIKKILTTPIVEKYLQKHQLVPQFQKSIAKFKLGNLSGLDFKIRKPKSLGIWSFRINKKYRALAIRTEDVLEVYAIDDHQ